MGVARSNSRTHSLWADVALPCLAYGTVSLALLAAIDWLFGVHWFLYAAVLVLVLWRFLLGLDWLRAERRKAREAIPPTGAP